MKKNSVLILYICLLLVACSPSPEIVQTAMAKTEIAGYTLTPTPTVTKPTVTPIPTATTTSTPIPTMTLTQTRTPVPTLTHTPLSPQEITATAKSTQLTATSAYKAGLTATAASNAKKDLEIYLYDAARLFLKYISAFDVTKNLINEITNSPNTYESKLAKGSEWRFRFFDSLEKLENAAKDIETIKPVPNQAKNMDSLFKKMAVETRSLCTNFRNGITLNDRNGITKASNNTGNIFKLADQVTSELEKLKALLSQ